MDGWMDVENRPPPTTDCVCVQYQVYRLETRACRPDLISCRGTIIDHHRPSTIIIIIILNQQQCGAVVVVIIWSPSLKHPRQEKSALLDLTSIAQLFFQIFRQEETGKKAGKTGNISEVRKFNRREKYLGRFACQYFFGGGNGFYGTEIQYAYSTYKKLRENNIWKVKVKVLR